MKLDPFKKIIGKKIRILLEKTDKPTKLPVPVFGNLLPILFMVLFADFVYTTARYNNMN